ncbi:hypothetical protein [Chryseobacterium wanjuense]
MSTSELNRFIVILIYGSLVLLALLKLSNPLKVNRKANFWFGMCLFLWSSFWLDEALSLVMKSEIQIHSILFIQLVQFLTPVMFYFSVLFYTNPSFRFRLSDIKYFILPGVFLIVLLLQRGETIESDSTFLIFLGLFISV